MSTASDRPMVASTSATRGPVASTQPGNVLETRQIEVVYNKVQVAVRGLSIAVPEGKVVAVLGPNGAGKTTLLRAISGFLSSESGAVTGGEVLLDGQPITGLPPFEIARKGVCIVPEEQAIFATLSVEDNLRVVPHPGNDASRAAVIKRIFDLFPILADRRKQVAGYMSGGERKMLAMSRALLLQPRVMLVDELSFGLAPVIVDRLIGVIGEINRSEGTSIVLVEQNAAAALTVADYAYIIETGQVVFDGTPDQLRGNADVQEFYLGLSEGAGEKSYSEVKQYRRKRRWGG
jgi:branched-chain amino acid transport system ATP-binding protein